MKKILFVFILLFLLTGCDYNIGMNDKKENINDGISTYKETVEDGRIEIDGISYEIQVETKLTFTYDDYGNILKAVSSYDDTWTDYIYEDNRLMEERRYLNDELSTTVYYDYEDDRLIKVKTVTNGSLEAVTEYSYGTKQETRTHYKSDGTVSFISTAYLDEDDKILKVVNTEADGGVMDSSTFQYDNDLLIKVIREKNGVIISTFNYEYNSVGDKILDYFILHGEANTLIAMLYDYEYDENLLPKAVITYKVQSPIADEYIRNYP